jgi:hypothetical protein
MRTGPQRDRRCVAPPCRMGRGVNYFCPKVLRLRISLRIASERVQPCVLAQLSRLATSAFGRRSPIIGSRPVAGRPRLRFLGLADIDFAIFSV